LIGDSLDAAKDAVKRANGRETNPDETPVFESFGINGRGADSISAKLNKAIRKAGVPESPRLTAYSFRHTMKEALRSAGVPDHVQRRLLGHAGQGVADRYGSRHARLAEAKSAIAEAMKHLGDVDDAIYSARERLK
jgi:integrase